MAPVSPRAFFRFAAEHTDIVADLYQRRDGMTESELLQTIRRHIGEGPPGPVQVLTRMLELGFIDHAPDASAQYEMTRHVAQLMAVLSREHQLTSVAVIRGYFDTVRQAAHAIERATAEQDGDTVVRELQELGEHVERMRHDSRGNREHAIARALRVKANRERLAPVQRYRIINRLWQRYLVPLRDMIDTEKAMDQVLDAADSVLQDAQNDFHLDAAVLTTLRAARARLRRMRRDVVDDFRESLREVTPLYEELRRESAVARGASAALQRAARSGVHALRIPERMGVCNWQQRDLISDSALDAWLHELRGYTPGRPPVLERPPETAEPDALRWSELDDALRAACPVDDVLAWLTDTYPQVRPALLLRAYGRIHGGALGAVRFGHTRRDYRHGALTLKATPMQLAAQNDVGAS